MADAVKDGPEDAVQDAGGTNAKNGSTKKKIIVISIIIAVQSVLVLLAGQFVIRPMMLSNDGEVATQKDDPVGRGLILVLDDIIVNLGEPEASRFLKVSVGLEVDGEKTAAEVEDRRPELRDIVITSVSGRPVDEVISPTGKNQIRDQLKQRFASSLQEGELMNVYFSDFVVQ